VFENRSPTVCAVACWLSLAVASFANAAGGQGRGGRTVRRSTDVAVRSRGGPNTPGVTAVPGAKLPSDVIAFRPSLRPRPRSTARLGLAGGLLPNPFVWPELAPGQEDELSPPIPPSVATPLGQNQEPSSIQPPGPSTGPNGLTAGTGMLQLDVNPQNAQVYVDGFYAGSVESTRLAGGVMLAAGWHRVEIRAPGYQTPAVNVTIDVNQTNRVQVALQPIP